MFTTPEKTPIDKEIDVLTLALQDHKVTSKEYGKILKRMTELSKLQPEKPSPEKLSRNTMLLVAANLLGIAFVTVWERDNVITSKAFGWILKR